MLDILAAYQRGSEGTRPMTPSQPTPSQTPHAQQSPAQQTPAQQLAHKRVLVVEDDYLVAMDIVRALERAGAEVIGPAPGVDSALNALERSAPDGAILD